MQRFETVATVVAGAVTVLAVGAFFVASGRVELAQLKDWQTLTGAILALIAASIAYWGATAKVRHDQQVLDAEILRRKLALYLKLEIALRALRNDAHWLAGNFMFSPLDADQTISRSQLSISEPPELEEAWTYLDLFPRHTIAEIRNIRLGVRNISQLVSKWVEGDALIWKANQKPPYPVDPVREQLLAIRDSAIVVADTLEPLIRKMAPEMDSGRRDILIYGMPDPSDAE